MAHGPSVRPAPRHGGEDARPAAPALTGDPSLGGGSSSTKGGETTIMLPSWTAALASSSRPLLFLAALLVVETSSQLDGTKANSIKATLLMGDTPTTQAATNRSAAAAAAALLHPSAALGGSSSKKGKSLGAQQGGKALKHYHRQGEVRATTACLLACFPFSFHPPPRHPPSFPFDLLASEQL